MVLSTTRADLESRAREQSLSNPGAGNRGKNLLLPSPWTLDQPRPPDKGGRFIISFVSASPGQPDTSLGSGRQLHAKCKFEAAASLPVASKSSAPSQKRQQDHDQAALITRWPACLPVSTCLSCHFTKNQVARRGEPPWQIGKCEIKVAASDKREMQRHMLFSLRSSTLPTFPSLPHPTHHYHQQMLPLSATAIEKHLGWGSSYHPSRVREAGRECNALIKHQFTLRWAKLTNRRGYSWQSNLESGVLWILKIFLQREGEYEQGVIPI